MSLSKAVDKESLLMSYVEISTHDSYLNPQPQGRKNFK